MPNPTLNETGCNWALDPDDTTNPDLATTDWEANQANSWTYSNHPADSTPIFLRTQVKETTSNDALNKSWQLYYNTTDNPTTATQVTTSSSPVSITDDGGSNDISDGANTTARRCADPTGTWQDGEYTDASDESAKLILVGGQYTEFQFCISGTSGAAGNTYYFWLRYDDTELDNYDGSNTATLSFASPTPEPNVNDTLTITESVEPILIVPFNKGNPQATKPLVGVGINPEHPLTRGLIGCWLFNEQHGSIVNDLSGQQNHGTVNGPTWSSGLAGPCLSFDSSEDRVTLKASNFPADVGTISLWLKPPTTPSTNYIWDTYGGSNSRFNLFFNEKGQLELYTDSTSRGTTNEAYKGTGWIQLTLTFYYHNLFINGREFYNFDNGGLGTPADDFYLGDIYTGANSSLNGKIANLMLWDRILSIDEIVNLYKDTYQMFRPKPVSLNFKEVVAPEPNVNDTLTIDEYIKPVVSPLIIDVNDVGSISEYINNPPTPLSVDVNDAPSITEYVNLAVTPLSINVNDSLTVSESVDPDVVTPAAVSGIFRSHGISKPTVGSLIDPSHIMSQNMLGCWLMNEGCGELVGDSSVNNRSGTLKYDAHFEASHIDFDGTQDYISIPNFPVNTNDFTLSVRYKTDSIASDFCLCEHVGVSHLRLKYDYTLNRIILYWGNGTDWTSVFWSHTPTVKQWYQLVFTKRGDELWLFINGDNQGKKTAASNYDLTFDSSNVFQISEDSPSPLDGQISHLMFWDRFFSLDEMSSLSANPYQMFPVRRFVSTGVAAPTPSVSDSLTIAEYIKPVVSPLIVDVNDTLTIVEYIKVLIPKLLVDVNDTVTIVEFIDHIVNLGINVNDAITIAEWVKAIINLGINVNDSLTITEFIDLIRLLSIDVNDTSTISEFVKTVITKLLINVNDSVTVVDWVDATIAGFLAINVHDDITINEYVRALITHLLINISDDLTIAEYVRAVIDHWNINVNDSLTIAEFVDVFKILNINVNDTLTVAEAIDVLIPILLVAVNDTLSITDVVANIAVTPLFVNTSDSIVINEWIDVDLLTGELSINVDDDITITEVIAKIYIDPLLIAASDTLSVAEWVDATTGLLINVNDNVTLAEYVKATAGRTYITFEGGKVVVYIVGEAKARINPDGTMDLNKQDGWHEVSTD